MRIHAFKSFAAMLVITSSIGVTTSFAAAPQKYVLNKSKSYFRVFLYKAGFAKALVDDHQIGASKFTAELDYNDDPSMITMSMVIDTSSLKVESERVNKDDRAKVQKMMLEQMNATQNKAIKFKSTKVKLKSRRVLKAQNAELLRLQITGDLTMNGCTKPVTVPVNMIVTDLKLTATANITIRQSKWGLDPYRSFLGAVRYKDKMKVAFKIVSQRLVY